MRISDWSSDVCSSDLGNPRAFRPCAQDCPYRPREWRGGRYRVGARPGWRRSARPTRREDPGGWCRQIGRASCRERVCQYVEISVVAVSLKNKKKNKTNTV